MVGGETEVPKWVALAALPTWWLGRKIGSSLALWTWIEVDVRSGSRSASLYVVSVRWLNSASAMCCYALWILVFAVDYFSLVSGFVIPGKQGEFSRFYLFLFYLSPASSHLLFLGESWPDARRHLVRGI